jgi:F-type H+-transporting ATPase subunit alpha
VTNGFLDKVPVERVGKWERELFGFMDAERKDVLDSIRTEKTLTEEIEARLKQALDDFNARFSADA